MPHSSRIEAFTRRFVETSREFIIGDKVGVILCAARHNFPPQARVFIHFEHVDADVERARWLSLQQRKTPSFRRSGEAGLRSDQC